MKPQYLFVLLVLFVTCSDEHIGSYPYPRVRTQSVTSITSNGALFQGEITFSTVKIIDHGFVWSTYNNPTLLSDKISLGEMTGVGKFSTNVEWSLEEGRKYYVKAYAKSDNYTVFGDIVEFVSLGSKAPTIEDFFPKTGTWGDTITINGSNLNGAIKFDTIIAQVVARKENEIKVTVPYEFLGPTSKISVTFSGNTSISKELFTINPPVINNISPLVGKYNDIINIEGLWFHPLKTSVEFAGINVPLISHNTKSLSFRVPINAPSGDINIKVISGIQSKIFETPFFNQVPKILSISSLKGTYGDIVTIQGEYFGTTANIVTFGNSPAEIIYSSSTEVKVKVPLGLDDWHLKIALTYNGQTAFSENYFDLTEPTISSFTPSRGVNGTDIIITGTNFNPIYNAVYIGSQAADVETISATEIIANIPYMLDSHQMDVTVKASGQSVIATQKLNVPWAFKTYTNMPQGASASVVAGSDIFIMMNQSNEFYKYVPESNAIIKKAQWPGAVNGPNFSFSANGQSFIGDASNVNLFAYNSALNSWTQKADLPFYLFDDVRGFAIQDVGYVISTTEMWQYDLANDSWNPILSFPNIQAYSGFVSGSSLFVFDVSETPNALWKYSSDNDSWTKVGNVPFDNQAYDYGFIFEINGKAYYGMPYTNELWEYSVLNNTWTQILDYGSYPVSRATSFSYGGKGYVIGGYNPEEIWEFDPNY
jgi:hypothetical protein